MMEGDVRTHLWMWMAMVLLARSVSAQTPVPVTASSGFSVTSVDHATVVGGTPVVARYEVRFVPGTGCSVVPPFDAGKPALTAGEVLIKPIAPLGTLTPNCAYTALVAAIGPGGEGVSAPSAPFWRVVVSAPAAPGAPTVRP